MKIIDGQVFVFNQPFGYSPDVAFCRTVAQVE
jgi:hypothetical protein